jgi:hypothetical protein
MTTIRIERDGWPAYAWQGGPADLFAARERVRVKMDRRSAGTTPISIIRHILQREQLPQNGRGSFMLEILISWTLEQAEEDEEAPFWLKSYLGEGDLVLNFDVDEDAVFVGARCR